MNTSFHNMIYARELNYDISQMKNFVGVFSSSNIKIYPYQIAAANFALNNIEHNGAILCDESGMGKSHEAMLVVAQKYLEGKKNIFIAVPSADLLGQWAGCIDKFYSIPYTLIANESDYNNILLNNRQKIEFPNNVNDFYKFKALNETLKEDENKILIDDPNNPFTGDGIILITNDVLCEHQELAKKVLWDLCVFDEANSLTSVYQETSVKPRILKEIASNSFKLLLTGTPIEKNIMDIYGLIYFIDKNALMPEQEFLQRYLRKPENYPELSQSVSKFCFRTLRSQAKQYAKLPNRLHITYEFETSKIETELYDKLYSYIQNENKIAFPEMNKYDLSLKLLGLLSSSTKAIIKTIEGIIDRISINAEASNEILELRNILEIANSIQNEGKTKALIKALPILLKQTKNLGANKKAVIFTESNETQKYLFDILKDKYQTEIYNASSGYEPILRFKDKSEILIANDKGAKGFNLEECSIIINYDLLYNSAKMEQRINRCHRLNQNNDVFVLNLINKNNISDIRKLELMSKRHMVSSGVFGITDSVAGGFTNNIEQKLSLIQDRLRTKDEIEKNYKENLKFYKEDNLQETENAENILYTTFTKGLADKINIVPEYIEQQVQCFNDRLWNLAKSYFLEYNEMQKSNIFTIDDAMQSITCNIKPKPKLGYYYAYGRFNAYKSLDKYSMKQDFRPQSGIISFTSKIGNLMLNDIECSQTADVIIKGIEPCEIALYGIGYSGFVSDKPVLIGKHENGTIYNREQCFDILNGEIDKIIEPYNNFTKGILRSPHSSKKISNIKKMPLDNEIDENQIVQIELLKNNKLISKEEEIIKSKAIKQKNNLKENLLNKEAEVADLKEQLDNESDRMQRLKLTRQITILENEMLAEEENIFLNEAKIDLECESNIAKQQKIDIDNIVLYRDFILKINCTKEVE